MYLQYNSIVYSFFKYSFENDDSHSDFDDDLSETTDIDFDDDLSETTDSDFDDDLSDITDSDFDGDLSEITNSFTAVEMPDE